MGDVLEYIVDGTSGLAPGGVDGSAIICGVCSKGEVGKGYLIGKSSDLASMLGVGPLVDRVKDALLTAGQEATLIAVPCSGNPGGYISEPRITGKSPACKVLGSAQTNADIVLEVENEGQLGTAAVKLSFDGGKTFGSSLLSSKSIMLKNDTVQTGATLVFEDETALLFEGTKYEITVRTAISDVTKIGSETSPDITVTGEVKAAAELMLVIQKSGKRNEATYQLSVDGGDTFMKTRTVPIDGKYELLNYGVTVTFPEGDYEGGTTYLCSLLAPEPSITSVMEALEKPLSLYDIEFVHVAAASNSIDWAAAGAKADELWNLHRPTYFKMEARLPYAGENLNNYTAALIAEKQNVAHRFVQVIAQFGEVTETGGNRHFRNFAGLNAGRVMSIPVQRAAGRVRDGGITGVTLPDGWEAVQPVLEDAGFVTAKKYAGLDGVYWGDSRTMADDTSDFRYEEVLRTVFKAMRKQRIAALKSMYDEAGDVMLGNNALGLAYLKANIENALDTMVKANPQELADYVVGIPSGQDIVNNGVAVETTLVGIPIIRQIKLYSNYAYAGSNFDPRLQ